MTAMLNQPLGKSYTSGSEVNAIIQRGRQIGERLDTGFQTAIDQFYFEGIPFGIEVFEKRLWNKFEKLNDSDPNIGLRNFLRFAFSGENEYKTSYNQANVVWMCVIDGISPEFIKGIGFSYLVKLAGTVSCIGREFRRELVEAAKTCKNLQEFNAMVDTAMHGHHYEPKRTKLFTGNKQDIQAINNFLEVSKSKEDTRTEAAKVADVLIASAATNEEIAEVNWNSRATMTLCRMLRRQQPSLNGLSDLEILGRWAFDMLDLSKEHHDEETKLEFAQLEKTRPY